MSNAEAAAADLRSALSDVRRGSLRVYGDWFGKPKDNLHWPTSADADGDELIITFNEDEVLAVTSPYGWTFTSQVFRISSARRVVWRWYSYGRPKIAENLFTQEHRLGEDGRIVAQSDVDWYSPTFAPSLSAPAVELQ
jgi:hypothetical protein